jgi:hypothetical protein
VAIGTVVVVILNNSSIHKRKDILEQMAQEIPNLIFFRVFTEVQSRDNLIELAWHSAKEFISK